MSFIIGTLAVALDVLNFFLNLDDRFTSAALVKEYMNDTNTMIRFWLWDKQGSEWSAEDWTGLASQVESQV